MRLPELLSVIGTIVAINDSEKIPDDIFSREIALTIQCLDGHLEIVRISRDQIEQFELKPIIFIGNIVNVDMNINIKDETYFINDDEDMVSHKKNLNLFRTMSPTAQINMYKNGVSESIIENLIVQRKVHSADLTPKPVKFHPSRKRVPDDQKEKRISLLLSKRASTLEPVVIAGIDARLAELGYVANIIEPNKPSEI